MINSKQFNKLINTVRSLAPNQITQCKQTFNEVVGAFTNIAKNSDRFLNDVYYQVAPQTISGNLLYEKEDHTFALVITSWAPFVETPPHDHPSWVLSTTLIGTETHFLWKHVINEKDHANALVFLHNVKQCAVNELVFLTADCIHSVRNNQNSVSISLQLYGMHPNFGYRKMYKSVNAIKGDRYEP